MHKIVDIVVKSFAVEISITNLTRSESKFLVNMLAHNIWLKFYFLGIIKSKRSDQSSKNRFATDELLMTQNMEIQSTI